MVKQNSYMTLIRVHSIVHTSHAPKLRSCNYNMDELLCMCVCVLCVCTRDYTHNMYTRHLMEGTCTLVSHSLSKREVKQCEQWWQA